MKETDNMIFINRGLKRIYIWAPITFVLLFVLFYYTSEDGLITTIGAFIFPLIMLLFFPRKYGITEENTIEFYHLFGRSKKRSIFISDISEITIKPYRMSVDYKTSEDVYLRSAVMELSEMDMKTVVDELMKRNPKIIIS